MNWLKLIWNLITLPFFLFARRKALIDGMRVMKRRQEYFAKREAERLDRIRNPGKYRLG